MRTAVRAQSKDTGAFERAVSPPAPIPWRSAAERMGIGPRWDTFQDRLRERRKEVIHTGSTAETATNYRKAS